MLVYLELCESN